MVYAGISWYYQQPENELCGRINRRKFLPDSSEFLTSIFQVTVLRSSSFIEANDTLKEFGTYSFSFLSLQYERTTAAKLPEEEIPKQLNSVAFQNTTHPDMVFKNMTYLNF